jgi:AbrB family looped-hinge helix DNA binding protein
MSSTVTRKGQVTIPKPVRDLLGIRPGTEVSFDLAPDGRVVLTTLVPRPATTYGRFRGAAGPGMTTDEIMALTRGED